MAKKQEPKAFPITMVAGLLLDFIKKDAFKDYVDNAFALAKQYVDTMIIRMDALEKRMTAMEHSLEIMVNARKKLGLLDDTEEPLQDEPLEGMKKSKRV